MSLSRRNIQKYNLKCYKNEEAGQGPVPCPSKAKWENERKEDEV